MILYNKNAPTAYKYFGKIQQINRKPISHEKTITIH